MAAAEFAAITSNEVPTAWGIGNPSASTSTGTITNPPPTPNTPVSAPATAPAPITTAAGWHLALMNTDGVMDLEHNWLPADWVVSHSTFDGTFNDNGGNVEGVDPGFADFPAGDLSPSTGSPLIDAGGPLHLEAIPDHVPARQYHPHQSSMPRPGDGAPDLGAFEAGLIFADGFESGDLAPWSTISTNP